MVAGQHPSAIAMTPTVSVLQLDTNFPRVPGDVSCPDTYRGNIEIIRVGGASVKKIVNKQPDLIDIAPFERALGKASGDVVVTSCGFLSPWQDHLAAQSVKPFVSSALTALHTLSRAYAPGEVMILTFDAASLTASHLGQFADYASGIVGLPAAMHLQQVISQDQTTLDAARVTRELSDFVRDKRQPAHKHLLLECTNLPPYKLALQQVTGFGVSDILTQVETASPGSVRPQFLSATPPT